MLSACPFSKKTPHLRNYASLKFGKKLPNKKLNYLAPTLKLTASSFGKKIE
jgi:hypothetical protein